MAPERGQYTYNRAMDSGKATALLKGVMALVCVIALAVHPAAAMGLALVGLLFVPLVLWLLGPTVSILLPVSLEQRTFPETLTLVSRFQRPPPSLL